MNNLFLLLTVISFLGIPIFIILALISIIRKNPAKKRFKKAGISALIFIASLIGFGFTMERPIVPETIELSIQEYQAEYDINTEIPINITVSPENADISSLEYIAEGNTITFSDSGIFTGSEEGFFNIYVQYDNITSNILSINVVDINAREEAKALDFAKAEEEKRLAEEQAALEAEQKRQAEETERKRVEEEKAAQEAELKRQAEEAEQKRIEEKAAQEAELKRQAEEAEQKRIEEEKAAQEAELKRQAEEAERKRIEEEKATQEAEQQQTPQEADTQNNITPTGSGSNFNTYDNVTQQETNASYVLNTGTHKIHYPSCKSVKKIAPQNYSTSNDSVDELISQGYTTCGNCF